MNKGTIGCVVVVALLAVSLAAGCNSGKRHGETHEKISETELPQAVRDGFTKAYPGATIKEVEKETYIDGTVHYEIGYRTADGKESDVEVNTDGDVLEKH